MTARRPPAVVRPLRLGLALALLILATAGTAGTAAAAAAVAPRASLPQIESEVMCVTCGVPLSIAESPQADHERAFILGRIARGENSTQIKRDLVAQLGPGVLALPDRHGFNLVVYIVPVALFAVLAGGLAVALPRWRRRGGGGADGSPLDLLELDPAESARLDDELARFHG
ncbi:MAG: cytochrome c-type biosis protein CcmH [Solirubrobacteraceae bacterium]|jgi:cytochrome c-type biogenesis protein CcmH|nr:cytochrome c-type biosis protein CcmH [Solirubrobacteraceae bacterium]